MVKHDPDITRLMDRLEARGLVRRERSKEDRRVVITYITGQGLELLESLDEPVLQYLKEQLGHLGERNLQLLIKLLESLREGDE